MRAETSDGTVPGALDGPEGAEELAEAAIFIQAGEEWVQGDAPSAAALALLSESETGGGAVAEKVARS